MKMHVKSAGAVVALSLLAMIARGDDLTTRDGTVYKGYKVLGHDAGFLTIMYADGGAKIPLDQLPDELQKKYGYNAAAAAAAAQAAAAQEQKDRQALKEEELVRQQQQAAAPLPVVSPGAPENVTVPGGGFSDSALLGQLLPPPADAISWKAFEDTSVQIGDLRAEMARLRLDTTGTAGGAGDRAKLEQDNVSLAVLQGKFNTQQTYVQLNKIAGPVMSAGELAANKTELASLQVDLARTAQETGALAEADHAEKDQRAKLLALEIQFANAPAPRGSGSTGPHSWEEAKSMADQRVMLFDSLAQLSADPAAHAPQISAQKTADANVAKAQEGFESQLWAHQVHGFKLNDAEIAALREQIATLEAEKSNLSKTPPLDKASAHTVFADTETLWLLKLKLQYANK